MNSTLHISNFTNKYIQVQVKQNDQNLPIKCKSIDNIDILHLFPNNTLDKTKEYNIFYNDNLLYNIKPIKYFRTINYTFWKCIAYNKQVYLGLSELAKKINIPDNITCIYEQNDKYIKIQKTNLYEDECFNISNIGIYNFLIDNRIFKTVRINSEQEITFVDNENIKKDYLITRFYD
ncbi:5001_t:CDS:1 [Scutellospora calospora]|uniref:5001_t:CDS:1 n=1 Tax=Scutellospora calospora TaxID=85575 RepID=A0ACA9MYM3_9GLOM|nr:5001_t:CDS:1 [Scutellospora calospora]